MEYKYQLFHYFFVQYTYSFLSESKSKDHSSSLKNVIFLSKVFLGFMLFLI